MATILVTPRSVTRHGHPALQRLTEAGYSLSMPTPGEQPSEAVLLDVLPNCIGYLAGVEAITARVLAGAPGLKAISRNGTGVDNIDLVAAERCGIRVLRAEGSMARGVAELTLALMLSLVRNIPYSDAQMKQTTWTRRPGIEIEGRALGLIGCGRIGRLVATLALRLGMEVVAYDPEPDVDFANGKRGFRFAPLEEVISRVDVLSLHRPAPESGEPLLDRARISTMKPGIFVINTARGELLDEVAMIEALESGQIAGLAIDTYRREPPGASPLVLHPQVIATPHIGAYTEESVGRTMELAVENLLSALR